MQDIEISKYESKFKIPYKYQFSHKMMYDISTSKITPFPFLGFLANM